MPRKRKVIGGKQVVVVIEAKVKEVRVSTMSCQLNLLYLASLMWLLVIRLEQETCRATTLTDFDGKFWFKSVPLNDD